MISIKEAKIQLSYLYVVGDLPEHTEWMNQEIIDALGDMITPEAITNGESFAALKPWIGERIRRDREHDPISRLPIAVVLYFLVYTRRHDLVQRWPLQPLDLTPIFTALGISCGMLYEAA
jgi:hypothetical protein